MPAAVQSSAALVTEDEVKLDKPRHIQYWTRCLKSLLPAVYTSNDSNRMYLAFFIISALDLLGALDAKAAGQERKDYINWIYYCQHPGGGFRAFPGTNFGDRMTEGGKKWDPANLPATYFALASLLVLGDDFKRVRRRETLQWLPTLQRPDGSFGETLVDGRVEGGMDTRFGYCATGVRHILRGTAEGTVDGVKDIRVDQFVHCVKLAETYDGGISDAPFHEAHAGFTFCAIGALSFLDRLSTRSQHRISAPSDPQHVIRWLVSRQTATLDADDAFDTEGDETDTPETCHDAHQFVHPQLNGNGKPINLSMNGKENYMSRPTTSFMDKWAGMNGRCNKVADTCYAFWVGASLHMFGHGDIADHKALRRYLLEKTANPKLGGFGKYPEDLPDLYHSYLGLAALSLTGDDTIKELDAAMCLSKEARARLNGLWRNWGIIDDRGG